MDAEKRFIELVSKTSDDAIDRNFSTAYRRKDVAGPSLPPWLQGQTLYEVYLRNFSTQKDITAFEKKLDLLQQHGFDLMWLMPVWEIGKEQRKGRLGCPYAVRDYYRINPEYGTKDDLQRLSGTLHKRGMRLILDMVANHVAPDYKALQDNPKFVQQDATGQPTRKVQGWSDIVDLDYSNKATREHMRDVIRHWLTSCNLDGYRCDVAGMVPLDFWEEIIADLKKENPDIYMLAEWDGPALHKQAFHSTYDWVLYELMALVRSGKESAHVILEWQSLRRDFYPENALPLRFLENHDKPRAAEVFGLKEQIPFLLVLYTLDGLPLVYNGQEIGARHKPSLFEHEPIEWDNRDDRLNEVYQKLIALRKSEKAMSSPEIRQHVHNAIPDVLLYEKAAGNPLLVCANMRADGQRLKLPLKLAGRVRVSKTLFNSSNRIELNGQELVLEPWQALLLQLVN